MTKLNRRNFLKGGICLGAVAGVSSVVDASQRRPRFKKHKHTNKTAVVIGSGFGGSVAALRLCEAGIPTILLERGKDWTYFGEDTFPTIADSADDGRTTWLGTLDAFTLQKKVPLYTGLMERIYGNNIGVVCAAGLGGGSLVYGGVLLQPTQSAFEQVFPYLDYNQMNEVYYPKVLAKISGGSIPDDILNTNNYRAMSAFKQDAEAAGLDVSATEVGFDWNIIRKEIKGKRNAAASVGEYIYGCNSNAKNTLDKNYLKAAMQTGKLQILTLHNVVQINQADDGQYHIQCEVLTTGGDVIKLHDIKSQYLFLAAGSMNTTKLLLNAKQSGDLPELNEYIGQYWGNNGDELTMTVAGSSDIGSLQGGPAAMAAHDNSNPIKPVTFMHSPTTGFGEVQFQLGMSAPDKLGSLSYNASEDQIFVNWPTDALTQSHSAYTHSLQNIAAQSNAVVVQNPSLAYTSWHACGGAVMGKACSYFGEVDGYQNLYVVDSALLPGSAGMSNPALTVAANAERIMEKILPRLVAECRGRHNP
ncbi:GMC family oxidoreductase N-terminal domain-containing protein [Colwellia sp. RE-S-Sl-9]